MGQSPSALSTRDPLYDIPESPNFQELSRVLVKPSSQPPPPKKSGGGSVCRMSELALRPQSRKGWWPSAFSLLSDSTSSLQTPPSAHHRQPVAHAHGLCRSGALSADGQCGSRGGAQLQRCCLRRVAPQPALGHHLRRRLCEDVRVRGEGGEGSAGGHPERLCQNGAQYSSQSGPTYDPVQYAAVRDEGLGVVHAVPSVPIRSAVNWSALRSSRDLGLTPRPSVVL